MELEEKRQFTIEHARILYQTIADIVGNKYQISIIAKVEEKN